MDIHRNAAIAYAVESVHVQHIIVLGHYGCKGVEAAIAQSSKISRLVRKWVRPIADMYTISRRLAYLIIDSTNILFTTSKGGRLWSSETLASLEGVKMKGSKQHLPHLTVGGFPHPPTHFVADT